MKAGMIEIGDNALCLGVVIMAGLVLIVTAWKR